MKKHPYTEDWDEFHWPTFHNILPLFSLHEKRTKELQNPSESEKKQSIGRLEGGDIRWHPANGPRWLALHFSGFLGTWSRGRRLATYGLHETYRYGVFMPQN